jgi:hypothetical protein
MYYTAHIALGMNDYLFILLIKCVEGLGLATQTYGKFGEPPRSRILLCCITRTLLPLLSGKLRALALRWQLYTTSVQPLSRVYCPSLILVLLTRQSNTGAPRASRWGMFTTVFTLIVYLYCFRAAVYAFVLFTSTSHSCRWLHGRRIGNQAVNVYIVLIPICHASVAIVGGPTSRRWLSRVCARPLRHIYCARALVYRHRMWTLSHLERIQQSTQPSGRR